MSYNRNQGESRHGTTKLILRIVGAVLIVIGIVLAVVGAIQQGSAETSDEDWFDKASGGLIVMFAGLVIIMSGFGMLWVSFARKIAGYYADETAPAIETATDAFGKGFSGGTQRGGGIRLDVRTSGTSSEYEGARVVVKTKCRNCGYLETEDADFCSKCGKRL